MKPYKAHTRYAHRSSHNSDDGAVIIDLEGDNDAWNHQVSIDTTEAAGIITVAIQPPGTSRFAPVLNSIDLSSTHTAYFNSVVQKIRLTPSGMAANKDYDVVLVGLAS